MKAWISCIHTEAGPTGYEMNRLNEGDWEEAG
jgi:hypothetical protein